VRGIPYAPRVADLANLVLAVDSTAVKTGVSELNSLTAAGARAEAATVGLRGGVKAAGIEAAAMASAAQLSARAAMDQAAGFGAATQAARVNTMAMRETLVVARELSRGNFSRIPGSLTLLAQGVGSSGGFSAYANSLLQTLGIIKQVQNAELAETATAAANAAAGVMAAAKRAAANVLAADTEIALAEAQVRVTEGTAAEAAAQARLAAAHEAVGVAAAEAAVAENALAEAQGRSAVASAASAAASRTSLTLLGTAFTVLGIGAGLALAGVESFKAEVRDSGDLDKFAESLRLSKEQIEKAGGSVKYLGHNVQEITGLTVTWGDIATGTFNAVAKAAGASASTFKSFWTEALLQTAQVGISSAQLIAGAFAAVGNIGRGLASAWHGGGEMDPVGAFKKAFSDTGAFFHQTVPDSILDAARKRLQDLSDSNNPAAPKKPKKENDHGLQEALDKLDAEIKGQYALAAAYQVSGAAAQRAIAQQKAAEDAISHKASADLFYAKELQKLVAEDVVRQAKTNAGLQVETSIRSQLNGQLADGTLSVAQYNQQLKLQTTLHGLNVDLENADTAHKQAVRDIIKQTIDLEGEQLQLESQLNALKQIASNDNEIARMRLETSLLGASNRERATAIAQLEAMQQLKDIDPNGLLTNRERGNFVQSAINRATAGIQSPFQQWAASVPQTAAAVNEALQSIQFKGLDGIASAITSVVTGTKSLGAAFKDVARSIVSDIIQMTVKMLIFRAISGIFGKIGGGASSGGVVNLDIGAFPARAGGGPVGAGQTYMVGERGPELFRPSSAGTIIPNHKLANDNGGGEITLRIVTDGSFQAQVEQISGQIVVQAVPSIVRAAASTTVQTLSRKTLNGR
jgi:lambda family phage tail tape measure protein